MTAGKFVILMCFAYMLGGIITYVGIEELHLSPYLVFFIMLVCCGFFMATETFRGSS